jgi:hypothetical protein
MKVGRRAQSRELFREGDVDELIQGNTFGLGDAACLVEEGTLQAKGKVVLPHFVSSLRATSRGNMTRILNSVRTGKKSRALKVINPLGLSIDEYSLGSGRRRDRMPSEKRC